MLAGELPFSAPTVPGLLLKQITEQAPNLKDRSPTCPEDLAACVMRSLEKEPEDRWPTADALRRALEARSATMYQPRRSNPARGRPVPPAGRELPPARRATAERAVRRLERIQERPQPAPSGEPEIVREPRSR